MEAQTKYIVALLNMSNHVCSVLAYMSVVMSVYTNKVLRFFFPVIVSVMLVFIILQQMKIQKYIQEVLRCDFLIFCIFHLILENSEVCASCWF